MPAFAEIYERIKLATSSRTQVELAEVLDIRQSSISDAKRRNSVPGDWYMKLFEKFGLNPDWLKQGVGPMYLRTEHGYMPQDAPAALAESAAITVMPWPRIPFPRFSPCSVRTTTMPPGRSCCRWAKSPCRFLWDGKGFWCCACAEQT